MATLVWDKLEDRRYENGVDRGVVYVGYRPGVVWNGLTFVRTRSTHGDRSQHYFDGVKYLEIVGGTSYQATIGAFSMPNELLPCIGEVSVKPGFILTRQPKMHFDFTYRTLVSAEGDYKIHLVYNAVLGRVAQTYTTTSSNSEPAVLEWKLDAIPPYNKGLKPSAHLIVDSRRVDPVLLRELEHILYGTDDVPARIPSQQFIIDIIGGDFIKIIDNLDGTWTYDGPAEFLTMIDSTTFEITGVNAVYLDEHTFEVKNTPKSTSES